MNKPWYKSPYPWIIASGAAVAAFIIGWFMPQPQGVIAPPQSLRLAGYQFIDPLLACNVNNSHIFPEDQALSTSIQKIIDTNVNEGNLTKGSTYFVNLANGNWSDVYQDDQYYPSSLGKIPIMMAYYEIAETDPNILDKTITYTGGTDLNDLQDIKPAESIVAGQTYTVEQLIEYMIKYSDNNATDLLLEYNALDQSSLANIYDELGIPEVATATAETADSVTPVQIAELFRVLYNGTYISRDYSEKALQLMSESSFTQGLAAGVPSSTVIAHKLGLVGYDEGNVSVGHELHDCGIVYANDPYILCVMTRGTASLPTMEGIIANISQTVYQRVESQS